MFFHISLQTSAFVSNTSDLRIYIDSKYTLNYCQLQMYVDVLLRHIFNALFYSLIITDINYLLIFKDCLRIE